MTMKQVREILERVRDWSPERQEQLARAVELIEEQDDSESLVREEQNADVR